MDDKIGNGKMTIDRRNFFKAAGVSLAAAGVVLTPQEEARAQAEAEKSNLERIAANSYGVRNLFKTRPYNGPRRSRRRAAEPEDVMNDPNAAGPLAVAKAAEAARAKLPTPAEQKAKYGEITLLDFPQFAKEMFPGVTHMDLYSGFFGDVDDNSMYFPEGAADQGFDPLSPSRTESGWTSWRTFASKPA